MACGPNPQIRTPVPEPVAAGLEHKEPTARALEDELVETGAGSFVMVFRSRNAPMRRRDAATICARERLIGGQDSLAHV